MASRDHDLTASVNGSGYTAAELDELEIAINRLVEGPNAWTLRARQDFEAAANPYVLRRLIGIARDALKTTPPVQQASDLLPR